jgi:hypothetical protein
MLSLELGETDLARCCCWRGCVIEQWRTEDRFCLCRSDKEGMLVEVVVAVVVLANFSSISGLCLRTPWLEGLLEQAAPVALL